MRNQVSLKRKCDLLAINNDEINSVFFADIRKANLHFIFTRGVNIFSLVVNIESAVKELESILNKEELTHITWGGTPFKLSKVLGQALSAAQNVFNYLEMALAMLKNYPDSNQELVAELENDLFGPKKPYSDNLVTIRKYAGHYSYSIDTIAAGGINVVINYLKDATKRDHTSAGFAGCIFSAKVALQSVKGEVERLKSRLQWTVMYPDSFTKDSVQIQERMLKHGFDTAWNQLSIGIENFLSGDFQDTCNALRNSLTLFVKGLAKNHGVDENQFGTQRTNLVKIGFMDSSFSDTLSKFYGHLSKFSKGIDAPSNLEAQYLLDMSLSVFGYLIKRVEEFEKSSPKKKSAERK
ncbi:MAG: hypothetical protein ACFFER_02680 [Candidatus Thorarchaeota archaeon]